MNSDNGWPRLRSSQRWPHLGWTSHVYGSVMRRHATKQILKKLKNIWHFRHFIDTCHLMCRIAGPSGSNFWSSEGVLEQFDGFRLQSNSGGNSLLAQVLNDELRFDECPRHGPFGSVWSYLDKFQTLLFWMRMQTIVVVSRCRENPQNILWIESVTVMSLFNKRRTNRNGKYGFLPRTRSLRRPAKKLQEVKRRCQKFYEVHSEWQFKQDQTRWNMNATVTQ